LGLKWVDERAACSAASLVGVEVGEMDSLSAAELAGALVAKMVDEKDSLEAAEGVAVTVASMDYATAACSGKGKETKKETERASGWVAWRALMYFARWEEKLVCCWERRRNICSG
jgi:hypothetical protein